MTRAHVGWVNRSVNSQRHGSLLTFWRFTNRIIIIIIIITISDFNRRFIITTLYQLDAVFVTELLLLRTRRVSQQ